jgi:P-type conjugative transfer protein TrbG
MKRMVLCGVCVYMLAACPLPAVAGGEGGDAGRLELFPGVSPAPVAAEGAPEGSDLPTAFELGWGLEDLIEPGEVPEEAVALEEPPVLARPDARRFVYGERVPQVACLPYRACTIRLAADETVLHLAIGDSERWLVEEVSSPGTRPVLVFKPTAYNLLTNLVIRTDRRLYVVELLSPRPPQGHEAGEVLEAAYDALVEFSYPHEWSREMAEGVASQSCRGARLPTAAAVAATASPSRLHFAYRFDRPLWPRHRLGWTPEVVYDDGERTYLRLPAAARHRDLPAVLVVGDDGEPLPVDASLEHGGEWLVVPAVARALRLVVGSEDRVRRLTIERVGGLR